MKRKTILVLMTLGILVFCNSFTAAEPITVSLWAAQVLKVGSVFVYNSDGDLEIVIATRDSWRIIESHVSVHTSWGLIPQTSKGNAIPGKFIWKKDTAPQSDHLYTIPLSSIDGGVWPGTVLYIAVHAVVKKNSEVTDDETAWACRCPSVTGPLEFPGKKWDAYFTYKVQE